jgi:predicted GIY-YIG superfamily endonuclease
MAYFVYWIVSGRLSYIGATVAPHRRLRQHNGELAGGARRTRSRTDWRFKCIVSGFRTWQEALQFEWAFKYHSRRCRGVESRALALTALMERERWTANAPLASDVPLRVEYDPCASEPPAAEAPAVPLAEAPAAAPPAAAPPAKARGRGGRRKGWKKTLRGVSY